jgi:hypothetical protein
MMCCRAIVAYIALVDALRSDAVNVESIHSGANMPWVTLQVGPQPFPDRGGFGPCLLGTAAVGPDWVTALTLIWAAGAVGSESVRAGQFATPRTVVSSLSQGREEVVRSEELALLGRPPRVAFGCGQGRSAVRGVRAVRALSVPG